MKIPEKENEKKGGLMKIPEMVCKAITGQSLHLIATASKEGKPNLIYVKFLKVYSETQLMVANNKFFKTEKNLLENPKMAIVVLDKETGKSYQLKGSVEIHKKGKEFEDCIEWVKETRVRESKPEMVPKAAVLLNVEEIYCGAERIKED